MGLRAAICLCLTAFAIVACGGGPLPPTSTDVSADGAVAPAAKWCPEAGENRLATQELIGLSLSDAQNRAEEYQCTVREIERDGEPLPATMDFLPTRINVAVENGIVTEVQSLG